MVDLRPVRSSSAAAWTTAAVDSPATNRRTTSLLTGAFSTRSRIRPLLDRCSSPWRSTPLGSNTYSSIDSPGRVGTRLVPGPERGDGACLPPALSAGSSHHRHCAWPWVQEVDATHRLTVAQGHCRYADRPV